MTRFDSSYKQTIFFILLIIGWIVVLFVESSQPPLSLLGEVQGLDKVAHFLAFSVLSLLVCCLSFNLNPRQQIPLFSMPLIIAILSGITEESYQMLVPGRAASLLDLLADICGAVSAIFLANRVVMLFQTNNRG